MGVTWKNLVTMTVLLVGTSAHAEVIPTHIDINLQHSNPALISQWQDKKMVKGFQHGKHITLLEKQKTGHMVCLTCHKEAERRQDIFSHSRKAKQLQLIVQAGGIKKYMHDQCVVCHKDLKKHKEVTGPTSCKGCHKGA